MDQPVTPKEIVQTDRPTPVSQVNSRGFVNPPVRYTRYTWQTKDRTMKEAIQRCILRIAHPWIASYVMKATDGKVMAAPVVTWARKDVNTKPP